MTQPHAHDSQLLQRIANGDEAALNELYDRHVGLVYTVALQMVEVRESAEEITLDTFTRVWNKAESYDPARGSVSTWLASIARHRAIDLLRQQNIRPTGHTVEWARDDEASDPADSLETELDRQISRQAVRDAVAQLRDEERDLISQAYFKGMSQREIAQATGIPLGTVKGRIRAAMQKLRQLLTMLI